MDKKKGRLWNLEEVRKVAKGLTKTQLSKLHRGAHAWACRNDQLDNIGCVEYVPPHPQNTIESVRKLAEGLSPEEFKQKHRSKWNWAQKKGLLAEVIDPECRKVKPRRSKVSLKEIGEAQRKYGSRSQLKKNDSSIYHWLELRGLLDGFFPLKLGNERVLDANGDPRYSRDMAFFIANCRQRGLPCNITNQDWIRHLNTDSCDVCGSKVTKRRQKGRNKHFDHCHETGKYRGTLCHQCNVAEGMLKTKENVQKLLEYLNRHA